MDNLTALQVLDQAAAQVKADRMGHVRIQQAYQTLFDAINELEGFKQPPSTGVAAEPQERAAYEPPTD